MSLLAVLLAASLSTAGDQTPVVPVIFERNSPRNTTLHALSRSGHLYASLTDFGTAFGIKATARDQKLELPAGQYTLEVTSDNPFVIVTDANHNANVFQLQEDVIRSGGTFYAPVEEFVRVIDDLLSEDVAFDRARRAIIVGHAGRTSAFDIGGLTFEEKSNGDLIRLQCSKKLPDYETWTKAIGNDTWLYMTIADARADARALRQISSRGNLRQVLVFQSPTSVQLTFKLKGQVASVEPMPAEGSNDILLAIHRPEEIVAVKPAYDYEKTLQRERERWKMDVVVIDAGHGGDDPGTIGVSRTKEKDVTLAIALKLGRLIERNLSDVRVVYTRKTDQFVELYRRGQIANQAGGKLFISIHCNSMPHKPSTANGFEIYLLRPGKTEAALRIAERENAVVRYEEGYEQRYQKLTEENFILLTMAQNAYIKYSEHFAEILRHEMGKVRGLDNNGVKQAGFYVLVGASMPNVLVETAYLSNRKDEKLLKSATGQEQIAAEIFSAVKRYKKEYEKSLEGGKDLGADLKR